MPLSHVGRLLAVLALGLDAVFFALVSWLALLGPIGFADETGTVDPNQTRRIVALGIGAIAALLAVGVAIWRYENLHRGGRISTLVLVGCLAVAHLCVGVIVTVVGYPLRATLIAAVQALLLGAALVLVWRGASVTSIAATWTMRHRLITVGMIAMVMVLVAVGGVMWPLPWRSTTCDWWLITSSYPDRLVVGVSGGIGDVTRVEISETPDEVRLACWTREPRGNMGPRLLIEITNPAVVKLRTLLNDRRVVDANEVPIPEKTIR